MEILHRVWPGAAEEAAMFVVIANFFLRKVKIIVLTLLIYAALC